jgi:hypothetical protein
MKVKQLAAELEQLDPEAIVNVIIHGQAFNIDSIDSGVGSIGNPHGWTDIIPAEVVRVYRQR